MYTLSNRKVLHIVGKDAVKFLHGLLTQNIESLTSPGCSYGFLLNYQGRYMYDMFIYKMPEEDGLFLDVEESDLQGLCKALIMYKLRSDVTISSSDQFKVVWCQKPEDAKMPGLFTDPRTAAIGLRGLLNFSKNAQQLPCGNSVYTETCLQIGLPEHADFTKERTFIMELGFDKLNAIDFDKGCYIGQEITTRTKRVGVVRKKVFCVRFDDESGKYAQKGDEIMQKGSKVGEMLSCGKNFGLALIRFEEFNQENQEDVVISRNGTTLQCKGTAGKLLYKPTI